MEKKDHKVEEEPESQNSSIEYSGETKRSNSVFTRLREFISKEENENDESFLPNLVPANSNGESKPPSLYELFKNLKVLMDPVSPKVDRKVFGRTRALIKGSRFEIPAGTPISDVQIATLLARSSRYCTAVYSYITGQWVSNATMPRPRDLRRTLKMAILRTFAFASNRIAQSLREKCISASLHHMGLTTSDFICGQCDSQVGVPSYMMVSNHKDHEIVVAIRGTASLRDIKTDLFVQGCPYQPYLEALRHGRSISLHNSEIIIEGEAFSHNSSPMYAHSGMLFSAGQVYTDMKAELTAVLAHPRYHGYKVLVTGHSMGGGISALLGAMLIELGVIPAEKLTVVAEACPAMASIPLREHLERTLQGRIYTPVFMIDMIPRLSLRAYAENYLRSGDIKDSEKLREFKEILTDIPQLWPAGKIIAIITETTDGQIKDSGTTLLQIVSALRNKTSISFGAQKTVQKTSDDEVEIEDQNNNLTEFENEIRQSIEMEDILSQNNIYLAGGTNSDTESRKKKHESSEYFIAMYECHNLDFVSHLIFGPNMWNDHNFLVYEASMNTYLTSLK